MSAAVASPSAGSLTNTGKRGGDGGGKPPRKPTGKGDPTGHYSVNQITEVSNIINKLDLAFITQIHQSAMALADAGEQVRLRVEGAAFLERNSRQRLAPKVPDMLDQEFHSSSCALTLDDDVFLKRHSTRSAGLQIIDYPILLAM
ncbi:uncharacterized protein M437DRAFT_89298 [Aureobasidium melanogenum CBS 110374]|uniref:Uncharacterized protein n=2 Tax=Aureobasidium melanogenum TaxID=46634 RepID=A0A074VJ57_AURM1|nr:uncharacterized protein M437DRAFT_89298 [Aureobasidium melanogenum CBS 110374]KEQ57607.1 hypothetical protein M437DRAFT_89298 [Aureobasidium melanogenum CBS 110374]